jgi:hypothetical protein
MLPGGAGVHAAGAGATAGAGMFIVASAQQNPGRPGPRRDRHARHDRELHHQRRVGRADPAAPRRVGADPATASSIFPTTATDVASMGIFLTGPRRWPRVGCRCESSTLAPCSNPRRIRICRRGQPATGPRRAPSVWRIHRRWSGRCDARPGKSEARRVPSPATGRAPVAGTRRRHPSPAPVPGTRPRHPSRAPVAGTRRGHPSRAPVAGTRRGHPAAGTRRGINVPAPGLRAPGSLRIHPPAAATSPA